MEGVRDGVRDRLDLSDEVVVVRVEMDRDERVRGAGVGRSFRDEELEEDPAPDAG